MVLQRFFDEIDDESDDADQSEEADEKEGEEEVEEEESDDFKKAFDTVDHSILDDSEEEDADRGKNDEDDDKAKTASVSKTEGQDRENESENSLSRRSKKRLEKYGQDKTKRRAAEKERRKRRAAEMRDLKEQNPEADVEAFGLRPSKKRLKRNKIEKSECKLRIAVDCSFDELMGDRDIAKLCKQIQSSYTMNRRLVNPLQLFVTGLNDESRVKKMFDVVYVGSANWDIKRRSERVEDVFPAEEIVYLTSESENILDRLDDSKIYVIGGLSDQDRHKGHCHKMASDAGFTHARLPIDEHVESPSCHVLTVSRVFGALSNVKQNGGGWRAALDSVMPKKRDRAKDSSGQKRKSESGVERSQKKKRTKRGGKKHRKNKPLGSAGVVAQ